MLKALFLTLLTVTMPVQAQEPQALIDGKTTEQVVNEYRQWSRRKNDYGGLSMFKEENASLGDPAPDEQRVVFMGDSITQSWSDASPGFFADRSWIERGISGQTTDQMLIRFRQDVIDLQPVLVIILAGTNDLAENNGPATNKEIQNNLASMADLATANGIKVILSSIMPVEDYPWRTGLEPAQRIIDINAWMRVFAEQNGHYYLDYYSSLVNDQGGMKGSYSYDGVHASKSGYVVMEGLAEAAIARALTE